MILSEAEGSEAAGFAPIRWPVRAPFTPARRGEAAWAQRPPSWLAANLAGRASHEAAFLGDTEEVRTSARDLAAEEIEPDPDGSAATLEAAASAADHEQANRDLRSAFEAGRAEGERASTATLAPRIAVLSQLTGELTEALRAPEALLEPLIATAAAALLEAALGTVPDAVRSTVIERATAAAERLSGADALIIALHPADHDALAVDWAPPARAAVIADPALPPGAVRVSAGSSAIEDRPGDRLRRLAAALDAPDTRP
jgi:flagellar biosynthesis/type III secretory pathway protein FliH